MKIYFLSQAKASKIEPNENMALISIMDGSSTDFNFLKKWKNVLSLTFDDVDVQIYDYILFSEEQAKMILKFIEQLPKIVDVIVVHCWAGISRSAAVAKFLSEYYHTTDFPSRYELYNKLVYSTLKKVWLVETWNDAKGEEK